MPSTATTRNRLEKQGAGENSNTWGTTLNNAVFDLIDAAADGVESYTLSGSKTLTSVNYAADEARMRVQNITGGTGGTVTIPAVQKNYIFRNGSSGAVVVSNGTNSVSIPSGNVEQVFTDGTNIYRTARLDLGSDLLTTTGTPTASGHLTTKTYVDAQIAAAVLDPLGGLGAGVGDFLTTPTSANLATAVTDETGSGALVFANSPTLVSPALGTPASGNLSNCTALPIGSVTGLGSGVSAFLASPTSANFAAAVTGETGTAGGVVFSVSPAFTGTPTAPTATAGTNTTQIATTAFVTAAVSAAGGGSVTSVNASGGTTGLSFSGGPVTTSGTLTLSGTLAVANGGSGVTTSTGTGNNVLSASPTFTGAVAFALGSAAAPAVNFGDADTGIYSAGANQINFAVAGSPAGAIDASGFATGVITATTAFRAANGSAATPSISLTNDTDTGLYSIGANQLGVSTGGTLRFTVSTTAVTSTLPVLAPDGAVGAPAYSFSGDTDTGMYRSGSNTIQFATGGNGRFDIADAAITARVAFGVLGSNPIVIDGGAPPATATSTGTANTLRFGNNRLYFCVSANTWLRSAEFATW